MSFRFVTDDLITAPLQVFLKEKFPRQSDETYAELAARSTMIGLSDKDTLAQRLRRFGNSSWKRFIGDLLSGKDERTYKEFFDVLAVCIMPQLFNRATALLRSTLSETLYIGPMRARSERYYRYQDLAVSEIDPDGKNFPMFLNSLPYYQIQSLSDWVERLFGYGIKVDKGAGSAGHISIRLTEKGTATANIVDVGYGVSQILPVLAQIWWARARKHSISRTLIESTILAIEQPELHLHPAHQALLANAIVGEASTNDDQQGTQICFVIETHSETLINRLGELIAEGKVSHESVQIILFEPQGDNVTTTRLSTFSREGFLQNWPFGFFQAGESR